MTKLENASPKMGARIPGFQFTVFEDVEVGPGGSCDSMTATNLDGYHYVNFWLSAEHASHMAMDNITLTVVFQCVKMGATGLVNMELPTGTTNRPISMEANSGPSVGGYGGFILRLPVVGPAARVIVRNLGTNTYKFSVYGYATA